MKKLLLLWLAVSALMPAKLLSQNYVKASFPAQVYTFYKLDGARDKIKSIPHIEVFYCFKAEDANDSLYIVGVYPDMKKRTENHIILGYATGDDMMFNAVKMYEDPFFRNDTIYVSSQVPFKATFCTIRWVWDEKTKMFEQVESVWKDSSWENLELGDSLLAAGDIAGAVYAYYAIEYPTSYFNEYEKGIELMLKAHELALAAYKNEKYFAAADFITTALTFWTNELYLGVESPEKLEEYLADEYGSKWTMEQFRLWLGDYGLFLYKAGDHEKSISVNEYLCNITPQIPGPYLQLGDTYFDKGEKEKSKVVYKKYHELMKSQKREKEIPKRVKERMK